MQATTPGSPSAARPESDGASRKGPFALHSVFWRRLARFGAAHMPEWWMHYSPPLFGLAAAIAVPRARKAVAANLERIRGPETPAQDALEIAKTFTTYASCLSEVLSYGSKNAKTPDLVLQGKHHMTEALAERKGVIVVTAHTAGWDVAGPVLRLDHKVDLVLVMAREFDNDARRLQDYARAATGLSFVHVGDDPMASLPLLRHLRRGAVVAIQIDRAPPSMRGRDVRLFGRSARVPEGPLRLAQMTGAPIVPMFCARLGFRRYLTEAMPPLRVPRDASEDTLNATAQRMTDAMADFLRCHPTHWFHFGGD
jgi:KDO2-lipid IV(A) lauroyltransferase